MVDFKYFKPAEFQQASPSCSIDDMDALFLSRLDKAREMAGVPFVINSAFRSVEYEKNRGRSGTSSHCKGLAVDLRCTDSVKRCCIVNALLCSGFRRIGIGKYFIHVDWDTSKQLGIWLYD